MPRSRAAIADANSHGSRTIRSGRNVVAGRFDRGRIAAVQMRPNHSRSAKIACSSRDSRGNASQQVVARRLADQPQHLVAALRQRVRERHERSDVPRPARGCDQDPH